MLEHLKSGPYKLSPALLLLLGLVLVSLACSLGDSAQAIRIRKVLPTFTPTGAAVSQAGIPTAAPIQLNENLPATLTPTRRAHLPTLTPTVMANQMAGAANQPISEAPPAVNQPLSDSAITPTSTATPTPTVPANPPDDPSPTPSVTNPSPTPSATNPNPTPSLPPPPDPTDTPKSAVPGWSFAGVRATIEEGNAIVFGELINNTGAPQAGVQVSGILYDQYDRVIIDGFDTLDYVPVEVVPVGARIPFELVIESDQSIYRIDLVGISAPADSSPRQDFQFSGVSQRTDPSGLYCIEGNIKNLGSPLEENLIVLATTYDNQGQVVSFGEHAEGSPGNISADQTSPFEICIDPVGQQISNHQLKAMGL